MSKGSLPFVNDHCNRGEYDPTDKLRNDKGFGEIPDWLVSNIFPAKSK